MEVVDAIKALEPWKTCMVGQVWNAPGFPREACVALRIGFESMRFWFWGIDALIRLAVEPTDATIRREVMRNAKPFSAQPSINGHQEHGGELKQ